MEYSVYEDDREDAGEASISKWEWAPAILLPLLALLYVYVAEPGGVLSRFCFFVCIGLMPGTFWRILGKSSWNVHRVFFAVSLVAFVLDNPDLRPDRESWDKILANWPVVALGFLVSFAQPVWGMLRTQRLLTDSGVVISKYDSFKLCLSGSFFNIFLPGSTGGDAYRVYAITHGYKTKLAPAIASITLDRLLGLPSLIFVVLAGMFLDYDFFRSNRLLSGLIPFISGAAVVCVLLVWYLAFAGKARRSSNWTQPYERTPGRKIGWLGRTHAMIATNVKRPATLPLSLFYGFLSHIACIVACLCFAVALGVEGVPPLRYFLIVPMVMTINSIPGAPGGVGQGELAMATLLDMAAPNMGNAQAGVMVMLLFRLSNMAMGILGGLYYAMGKMDFSRVDHVSQGLTRIMHRSVTRVMPDRFSARVSRQIQEAREESQRIERGFKEAKEESQRLLLRRGEPEPRRQESPADRDGADAWR